MLKKLIKISIIFLFIVFVHVDAKAAESTDIKKIYPIKELKITFNQEISFDSAKENIKVRDSKGQYVDITLGLGQDKKSIIVNPPKNGYETSKKYTLYVDSNIKSSNGKCLNKGTEFAFYVEGYQPKYYMNIVDDVTMKKADEIIASVIKPGMTDFEKELALHDYVVAHTEYDFINYINNTIPDDSYTAYGVLIKGIGVCEGYSEAMALLLNKAGIESIIIVGREMNHAWNLVKIDGSWYHLDATWDDTTSSSGLIQNHSYFNLTDYEMELDHSWDRTMSPVCNNVKYTYNNYLYCKKNNISLDNPSRIISGIVTLPNGDIADKDITVEVIADSLEKTDDYESYYKGGTRVIISKGCNSAEYSIIVPNFSMGYILGYRLLTNVENKYKSYAYYRENTDPRGGITYPEGQEPEIIYYKNGAMSTDYPSGTPQDVSSGNKTVNLMLVPYEQNDFEDFIIN